MPQARPFTSISGHDDDDHDDGDGDGHGDGHGDMVMRMTMMVMTMKMATLGDNYHLDADKLVCHLYIWTWWQYDDSDENIVENTM